LSKLLDILIKFSKDKFSKKWLVAGFKSRFWNFQIARFFIKR